MKMPAEIIREEIARNRVIPFVRFMELALYCPETGYYESNKDNVGRAGDFITSVSTGQLFGELLAFQFAAWLAEFQISNLKFEIHQSPPRAGFFIVTKIFPVFERKGFATSFGSVISG